jgi:hypothetical protein
MHFYFPSCAKGSVHLNLLTLNVLTTLAERNFTTKIFSLSLCLEMLYVCSFSEGERMVNFCNNIKQREEL